MDNPHIRKIHDNRPHIIEFSQIDWIQNNALNYLKDSQPDDFFFIGFLEHFQTSLELCSKALGWQKVPSVVWENKIPSATKDLLSQQEKDFILSQNKEELNWYLDARKRFLGVC